MEACVSRMQVEACVMILHATKGLTYLTCMQTMNIDLRYIAVSATVPNLEDIATWLNAKRKACISGLDSVGLY